MNEYNRQNLPTGAKVKKDWLNIMPVITNPKH